MISYWKEHGPSWYAPVQKTLIRQAWQMLRPGGYLLYSTCTFSLTENEEVIDEFLEEFPDMELCPVAPYEGFAPGITVGKRDLSDCVHIFPHRMEGEGHFLALLRKSGDGKQREMLSGAGRNPEIKENREKVRENRKSRTCRQHSKTEQRKKRVRRRKRSAGICPGISLPHPPGLERRKIFLPAGSDLLSFQRDGAGGRDPLSAHRSLDRNCEKRSGLSRLRRWLWRLPRKRLTLCWIFRRKMSGSCGI